MAENKTSLYFDPHRCRMFGRKSLNLRLELQPFIWYLLLSFKVGIEVVFEVEADKIMLLAALVYTYIDRVPYFHQ